MSALLKSSRKFLDSVMSYEKSLHSRRQGIINHNQFEKQGKSHKMWGDKTLNFLHLGWADSLSLVPLSISSSVGGPIIWCSAWWAGWCDNSVLPICCAHLWNYQLNLPLFFHVAEHAYLGQPTDQQTVATILLLLLLLSFMVGVFLRIQSGIRVHAFKMHNNLRMCTCL